MSVVPLRGLSRQRCIGSVVHCAALHGRYTGLMLRDPYIRLTLIAFLLFMARGMTGPLSSVYWHVLGASYLAIGFLGTLTSLTAVGASYVWGRAVDRLGRRPFLLGGLAALVAGYALLAGARRVVWLYPLYVFIALAQAAYDTAALALIGDWLEVRQGTGDGADSGRRMGTYRGLGSLGFGLMAFVSGAIADQLSLRVPFALAAAIFGVAFLLALGVFEPTLPTLGRIGAAKMTLSRGSDLTSVTAPDGGSCKNTVRRRLPLAPLLIAALLWSLVTGAVYAVWANYMVDGLGYTPAQMTRLWAVASLSEFPLMILAGWLSDRLGRLPMLAVGFLTWAAVFAGYLLLPMMPWLLGVQLLRGFAYSAHTATAMTYAAEVRARAERGRIAGLYGTAGALGGIIGASLGGAVAEYLGFRALIGGAAAVILLGACYLALAAWGWHRAQSA